VAISKALSPSAACMVSGYLFMIAY